MEDAIELQKWAPTGSHTFFSHNKTETKKTDKYAQIINGAFKLAYVGAAAALITGIIIQCHLLAAIAAALGFYIAFAESFHRGDWDKVKTKSKTGSSPG